MFRKKLIEKNFGQKQAAHEFHWRSKEISRIEGFSDAVFAFAVTLLIVSLEVPKTFDELLVTMRGFGAFAISFVMLYQVWHQQYIYFRRYGLEDFYTVVLNGVLLFTILFFIYPLKFLWTLLMNLWFGPGLYVHLAEGGTAPAIRGEQMPLLMAIYGIGMATTHIIFALLYRHAKKNKERLHLTAIEVHDTDEKIGDNVMIAVLSVLSIGFALAFPDNIFFSLSWICYVMIGPASAIYGSRMGKKRNRLVREHEEAKALEHAAHAQAEHGHVELAHS